MQGTSIKSHAILKSYERVKVDAANVEYSAIAQNLTLTIL